MAVLETQDLNSQALSAADHMQITSINHAAATPTHLVEFDRHACLVFTTGTASSINIVVYLNQSHPRDILGVVAHVTTVRFSIKQSFLLPIH